MELHYFRWREPNFGDDLNAWLWHAVAPKLIDLDESQVMVGIGTVLGAPVPGHYRRARQIFSLGSGVGYGELPDVSREPWAELTVRGPLSAQALGLPETSIGTDGAILLGALEECRPLPDSERAGTVFMPHHKAFDIDGWREACARAGVIYLDPRWDSRALVQAIRGAKLVLADAMHAAIVADTMRVPWVALANSGQISTVKWLDWTRSLKLDYRAIELPPVSRAARIAGRFLHWYDEQHWIPPGEISAATIARRLTTLTTPSRVGWRLRRVAQTTGNRVSRMVDRWEKAPVGPDVAAAALVAAAKQPGMLSEEGVFRDKLAFMRDRLDRIQRAKPR